MNWTKDWNPFLGLWKIGTEWWCVRRGRTRSAGYWFFVPSLIPSWLFLRPWISCKHSASLNFPRRRTQVKCVWVAWLVSLHVSSQSTFVFFWGHTCEVWFFCSWWGWSWSWDWGLIRLMHMSSCVVVVVSFVAHAWKKQITMNTL